MRRARIETDDWYSQEQAFVILPEEEEMKEKEPILLEEETMEEADIIPKGY